MAQQITSLLDDPTQAVSLDTFSGLTKGCPAPFWLFQGVCAAWGIDHQRAQLNLITVSENATFLLLLDGEPKAWYVSRSRAMWEVPRRWRRKSAG